jgi:hypothetical protein
MRLLLVFFASFLLAGCNGYQMYYKPIPGAPPAADVIMLKPGEAPRVVVTKDMPHDMESFYAQGYVSIGSAIFNGIYQSPSNVEAQARSVGATLAVTTAIYTGVQASTSPTPTYVSGSVITSNGPTSVSGVVLLPQTTYRETYDQGAYFLVRLKKLPRFGVKMGDMTPAGRRAAGRNTGVFVVIVMEHTPAFAADLVMGDVIYEVNGVSVPDMKSFFSLIPTLPANVKIPVRFVRDGVERTAEVVLE